MGINSLGMSAACSVLVYYSTRRGCLKREGVDCAAYLHPAETEKARHIPRSGFGLALRSMSSWGGMEQYVLGLMTEGAAGSSIWWDVCLG